MKSSIFFKLFTIIILGSFLFIGCGSGDGNVCYGVDCTNSGEGNTPDGGSGGEDPDAGGNNSSNGGDSGNTQSSISANLTYDSLENNISDYRGMFNFAELQGINRIESKDLDEYSTIYEKEIIYHKVDAKIASKLFLSLDKNLYPLIPCTYVDSPPYCETFSRNYYNLPLDIRLKGINRAIIVFNQAETTGCADGSGVCDITLMVTANSKYRNNTNPIELNEFKRALIGDYIVENDMKLYLRDIEQNATTVSLTTYTRYYNMNLSAYRDVNYTIRAYTDELTVNDGLNVSLPQIPMHSSGINGEGVTLEHDGAYYKLENTYVPFESKQIPYDVNETDSNHPNYWMFSNVGDPDDFSDITLCQRTANATNATNATYTCEKGNNGNISAHWTLQGKSVDLGW
ncbi:MAG: hypothetical protein LBD84_04225 [Campylobacteraceae bacterium]|jgi:hypothetical protein|nr:hypothetical protein [Campylobacteraceae bacterium]